MIIFFYGQNLTKNLINNSKLQNGAKVLLHKVLNPELFGVAKLNNQKKSSILKKNQKNLFQIMQLLDFISLTKML